MSQDYRDDIGESLDSTGQSVSANPSYLSSTWGIQWWSETEGSLSVYHVFIPGFLILAVFLKSDRGTDRGLWFVGVDWCFFSFDKNSKFNILRFSDWLKFLCDDPNKSVLSPVDSASPTDCFYWAEDVSLPEQKSLGSGAKHTIRKENEWTGSATPGGWAAQEPDQSKCFIVLPSI